MWMRSEEHRHCPCPVSNAGSFVISKLVIPSTGPEGPKSKPDFYTVADLDCGELRWETARGQGTWHVTSNCAS